MTATQTFCNKDLNDRGRLRSDPLLPLLGGKRELDAPLTGHILRYHKVGYPAESMDWLSAAPLSAICLTSSK